VKPRDELRADKALLGVVRNFPRALRKCTSHADEQRASKEELEKALRAAGLDGHRSGSYAAFVIGVAVTTLHGWRNPKALDRLPTRKAIDRLEHVAEMLGNVVQFRKVVGVK
jgi:hypothetical protein